MKWLAQGLSKRAIARNLWRHHSTICDEIKRNKWRREYSASKAKHKAYVRRLHAKKNLKKIRVNDELEKYIHEKIKDDWSPEMVSWRRNRENMRLKISTPTIYKYIECPFGYSLREYLYMNRSWRRKRKWNKNKNNHIKWRTFIEDRPKAIWDLVEFGHYECDLIVGPQWTKVVLLAYHQNSVEFMKIV